MSSRAVRLLVVPTILFAIVSGSVFGFAQWHPAKSEPKIETTIILGGDPVRGQELFAENCATCHGAGGEGDGVGPRLVGREISAGEARATIENGSGVMPAGLVAGQDLDDVVAYLETLLGR